MQRSSLVLWVYRYVEFFSIQYTCTLPHMKNKNFRIFWGGRSWSPLWVLRMVFLTCTWAIGPLIPLHLRNDSLFAWLHLTSSFDIFYPSCLCIGASKGHFFQHAEYVFNPINFGLHFVSFCFYNCILWQLHLIYGVIILFIVKTNH